MNSSTYTLADVTEAGDDSDLARKHDISRTLDTIDQGFATAVIVVKLRLGDGIVDVNSGNLQFSLAESLVEVMYTSRGLF